MAERSGSTLRRGAGIALAVVVALALLAACDHPRTIVTSGGSGSAPPNGTEQQIIGEINGFRAAHGLGALSVQPVLEDKAHLWSKWMAGGGCGPGAGGLPAVCHASLTAEITVHWSVLEENVGAATPKTAVAALESGFEHSAEHAANMLNSRITGVGVGVAYTGNAIYVAEEFMAP